jgi:hypothetical protein
MPIYTDVVTYSATNGFAKLSLCARHNADERTRYTEQGHPFANVYHGWHRGTCDECKAEVEAVKGGGAS